ncbi:hypothetical protein niasHT_039613 [Heterodera trifolii]|uniref:C2H2-type domain-containing protein n=1 Tax=Heterodera trifolii TaxID=157864 RepID=A0ABD2IG90_9BILA
MASQSPGLNSPTFQSPGFISPSFLSLGLNSPAFQSQGLNSTAFHHWDSILHHSNSRDSISPEFQSLGHNSTQFSVEQRFLTVTGCIVEDTSAEDGQLGQLLTCKQPILLDHPQLNSIVQIGGRIVPFFTDQQPSFSAECSQFPSSSCNLLPHSAHFTNVQPAKVPLARNIRRPILTCPECRRRFDNSDQFQAHFEPCWINAVERELRRQHKGSFQTSSFEDNSVSVSQAYRMGINGEELHFDGEPTLLNSKSGTLSLFVSLESQLKEKADSVNGKANCKKKTAAAEGNNSPNYENAIFEKVDCPVCGKRLFRHNLLVHHRIHTGELPFPCAFCSKRFRTTSARIVHHRSHTGEKPYICSFCQYACTTKRNLERHVHIMHFATPSIAQKTTETQRELEEFTDESAIEDTFQ